ncbi:MAG: acetylxylan esterase [Clostridia bacterium]|nr:acetylxylan esterase [Clostridia bacterium]
MENEFAPFSKVNLTNFYNGTHNYDQFNDFIVNHQLEMLKKSDEKREELDTVEKVKAYAAEKKKKFLESFGDIPERDCPMNPKILKTVRYERYRRESVVFNSRKGVYITGSMYIPNDNCKPSPAVLFVCGHSENARMYSAYQNACQTLVNSGLVVLAVDPIGQGERKDFYDPETGEYALKGAVDDHDRVGMPSMCAGRFLGAYIIRDLLTCVDYMQTRPEIDPEKIGITGCSGGGTQTLYVMSFDDRIAAAAPVAFTTTRREIIYTSQVQDACQIWPGCAEYGFDHFEPFIIFAPRPVEIMTASADFFPIEGAYEVLDKMKCIYSLFGKESDINLFEYNDNHGYAIPIAQEAASFFCKVFGIERKPDVPVKPIPDSEMQTTKTGNVRGDFEDALTIPDETDALAARLREERKDKSPREWLSSIVYKDRLFSKPWLRMFSPGWSGHVNGYTARYSTWWVQKYLAAYGVLILKGPRETVPDKPTIIALWDNGTAAIPEHEDWIKARCDEGNQVLVVDLPGTGNNEQTKLNGSSYHGPWNIMYRLSTDLLYMGDSMPAFQTYNLLRTEEMVREVLKISDVSYYCDGKEGVYGILAGYLSKTKRTYGENIFTSVEKDILGPRPFRYDNTLNYLIPFMLEHFDYNELM